jgi:hypothetical protein
MGTVRHAFRIALKDGIPLRSLMFAVVVGTVLNVVNQGDALLSGAAIGWFKVILTYVVPYCSCTYGAVSSQMHSLGSSA